MINSFKAYYEFFLYHFQMIKNFFTLTGKIHRIKQTKGLKNNMNSSQKSWFILPEIKHKNSINIAWKCIMFEYHAGQILLVHEKIEERSPTFVSFHILSNSKNFLIIFSTVIVSIQLGYCVWNKAGFNFIHFSIPGGQKNLWRLSHYHT